MFQLFRIVLCDKKNVNQWHVKGAVRIKQAVNLQDRQGLRHIHQNLNQAKRPLFLRMERNLK